MITDILKFLGVELGTQIIYSKKGNDVTCILKGEKDNELIEGSLEKFIAKYVLCQKCGLPEIFLKVENKKVRSKCNSCGADCLLDNKHQIASYIVKNPPKNRMEIIGAQGVIGEGTKVKTKSKRKFRKYNPDEDDKQFIEDTRKVVEAIGKEDFGMDSEALTDIYTYMEEFVEKVMKEESLNSDTADLVYKRLKMFRIPISLKDRFDYLFFQTVFTSSGFIKQVEKRGPWISKIFLRARREKFLSHAVVLNSAYLFFERYPETDPKLVSTMLMKCFEAGILDEKFCLSWMEKEIDGLMP